MLPIMNMISYILILVLINMVFFSLYDLFHLKDYFITALLYCLRGTLYFVCFRTLFNQLMGQICRLKYFWDQL